MRLARSVWRLAEHILARKCGARRPAQRPGRSRSSFILELVDSSRIDGRLGATKITDDKLDILQNLEFSVVEIWRAHPEMSDYAALRAYEAAFQTYRDRKSVV